MPRAAHILTNGGHYLFLCDSEVLFFVLHAAKYDSKLYFDDPRPYIEVAISNLHVPLTDNL